eukprot:NODE_552_length_6806_cov_0.530938.p3 type:complete len:251 gc:universal NODE_552_length_6806_cov_0.530938:1386-2138(+)
MSDQKSSLKVKVDAKLRDRMAYQVEKDKRQVQQDQQTLKKTQEKDLHNLEMAKQKLLTDQSKLRDNLEKDLEKLNKDSNKLEKFEAKHPHAILNESDFVGQTQNPQTSMQKNNQQGLQKQYQQQEPLVGSNMEMQNQDSISQQPSSQQNTQISETPVPQYLQSSVNSSYQQGITPELNSQQFQQPQQEFQNQSQDQQFQNQSQDQQFQNSFQYQQDQRETFEIPEKMQQIHQSNTGLNEPSSAQGFHNSQ